jgi:hypothetical protein
VRTFATASATLAVLAPALAVLAAFSDLAQIERIEIATAPEVTVTLYLTEPVGVSATSDDAERSRIVVELGSTRVGSSSRTVSGGGPLRSVRTQQADASTARVVLDLSRPTEFRVESRGSVVVVTLVGAAAHDLAVPQVEPPIVPPP